MLQPHNIALQQKLFKWSQYLAVFVIVNALSVLIGWYFTIELLKHPLPVTLSTNPVTAVTFIFSGISFLLISSKKLSRGWYTVANVLAVLVLLIAVLKITTISSGVSIPVDRLLFPEKIKITGTGKFVGMATNTAISFILLAASLLLMNVETSTKKMPAHYIALLTALLSLLSIIGYINNVQKPFYGNPFLIPLGIHAAIFFFLLSLSLLFVYPHKGLAKELTTKYTGSIIARKLLPVVIVIPIIIGVLRLLSHWNNFFAPEVGTTIVVFVMILIFLGFLWYNTVSLNTREAKQEEVELGLQEAREQIQTIFRSAPDAVILIDEKGLIISWNPKAEIIFGWKAEEIAGKLLKDTIIPHRYRDAHETGMQGFLKTGEGSVLNKTIEIQAINKEEKEFDISLSISPTKVNDKYVFIGFIRDITEQRKAEENTRYNALLLHNISDAVISTDENLIIKSWSEAAERMYGYTEVEALGQRISLLKLKLTEDDISFRMGILKETGYYKDEYTAFHKNGKEIAILASVNVITSGDKITGYVAIHHDINERKQLEEQLKKFNEALSSQVEAKTAEIRHVFERVNDAFLALDKNWCYTYVNKQLGEMVRRNPKSLIGKNIWEEFPDAVGSATYESFNRAMREQQYVYNTDYYAPLDLWQENHIYPSPDGLSVFIRNITEKKKAEEKLIQSEKRFHALVENNEGIISLVDEKLNVLFRSSSASRITGWTNPEYENLSHKEYVHPDDIEYMQGIMTNAMASPGRPFSVSLRVQHKKGHYIWLEGVINNMMHDPSLKGVITNVRDVTERVEAEQKIIKANRLYYFISQINQMIVRTTDEQTLFSEACNIAISYGKFKMAWIGMIDEGTKKVIPVMHAGDDDDSVIKRISVHEDINDRDSTGTNLREGKYTVCNDIENDPQMVHWKQEAIGRGYKSSMTLPIKKFGKVVGVFSFYTSITNFFDAEEIILLEEATGDVSFALELFEKERLRKKADELLVANEKRFRKLVENGNDAFVILTPEGKPLYMSSSVERVLGYTEEEAFKLDLFSLTHPDDMEEVQKAFVKALENPGTPVPGYTSRLLHKDGTWHWFEDTITNLIDDPDIGGIIDNFRDVTEKVKGELALKESEERYRSLIEQASDAIFINDAERNLLDVNESACSMLGYTKEQLCGMSVKDLYTKEELSIRPIMQKELLAGKKTSIERNMLCKNGTEIPVDITAKMLSDGRVIAIVRDISERRRTEAEITRVNREKETALNRINDSVVSVDNKWRYTFLNDAALATHPLSKEETMTKTIWEVHPQMAGTIFWDKYHEAMEKKIVVEIENYYAPFKTWFYVKVYPSENGLTFFYKDISERKKAEEEIRKSNERFELIGKAANDAVWEWNLETNVVWGNETHQQLYGLTLADPIPNDDEWKRRLHEDDRNRVIKSIAKTLESNSNIWDAEYRLYTENKGWINIYGRTYIERNREGKPVRMLGSMMDITERKEAEQQILKEKNLSDSIINSLPGVFYLFDTTPKFLRWNKYFETISGYSGKELGSMVPMSLFDDNDKIIMKKQIEKTYKEGYSYAETSLVTKSGQKIPFYFTGVYVSYEGAPCILGTGIDISKRKKAEDEMLQMNKQLRELSEHLQNIREEERLKMSREIHDELGQQLTVMKMDVSWLHKKLGKTDEAVKKKTEALKGMLDETVKSVRRISSELRPSVLDDMGLAVAIEWHLAEFEKRSGVKTKLNKTDKELVLTDAMKIGLFRIVQESLTNVARYAEAKNVVVSLGQNENDLLLSIKDDGVGFDKEKIATKKTLGILGMKERTNMMGGEYEIKSIPGNGTTVTVKIPLH